MEILTWWARMLPRPPTKDSWIIGEWGCLVPMEEVAVSWCALLQIRHVLKLEHRWKKCEGRDSLHSSWTNNTTTYPYQIVILSCQIWRMRVRLRMMCESAAALVQMEKTLELNHPLSTNECNERIKNDVFCIRSLFLFFIALVSRVPVSWRREAQFLCCDNNAAHHHSHFFLQHGCESRGRTLIRTKWWDYIGDFILRSFFFDRFTSKKAVC